MQRIVIWVFLLCALYPAPASVEAQEAVEYQDEKSWGDYRSWSLFISCRRDWFELNENEERESLYEEFKSFGEAIGDHHAAVWFPKKKLFKANYRKVAKICRNYGLSPRSGPFLIVTKANPHSNVVPLKYWKVDFGGMDETSIANILNAFALEMTGRDFNDIDVVYSENKERAQSFLRSMVGFFEKIPYKIKSFTVKTAVVEAEFVATDILEMQ